MSDRRKLSRLAELCLRIADEVESRAEEKDELFVREFGLGYRCITDGFRNGIKEMIDLQNECCNLKSQIRFLKISEKTARDFVEEVFGDREVDTLNDEYKKKIKEFVQGLDVYKEVEENE